MRSLDKDTLQKFSILIGIIIIGIGLVIHLSPPAEIKNSLVSNNSNSGQRIVSDLEDNYTSQIQPNIDPIGKEIILHYGCWVESNVEDTCLILILSEKEYEKFYEGLQISDLDPLKIIEGEYDSDSDYTDLSDTIKIQTDGDIFIVFFNQNEESIDMSYFYFYSIIPSNYYPGLIITLSGVIFTFSMLIWYFSGWKRYFALGIGINVVFFLIRIATIPFGPRETLFIDYLVELYKDYEFYYMDWGGEFVNGAWPYSEPYFNYIYGPLFILTIGIFAFLPFIWAMAIPLLLFTIGTGYLVYRIVYKLTNNEKHATFSMLIYFLNPFTLMYASYIWLNPPFFVFFVMLAFYLALLDKKEYTYLSLFFLGIAIMYKQFALIFAPLILLLLIKRAPKEGRIKKIKNLFTYISILGLTILLVSLPFLIMDYDTYLSHLVFNHTTYSIELLTTLFNVGAPVNFNSFFLFIGAPEPITVIIAYALVYYVLLGGCMLIIYLYYFRYSIPEAKIKEKPKNQIMFIEILFLSIFLIICVQLFFPRGTYKFYLILLAPFVSIFFDSKDLKLTEASKENEFKFHKRYLIPLIFSWAIFFCYRYVYFLILIAWIIYLIHNTRYEFTQKKRIKS